MWHMGKNGGGVREQKKEKKHLVDVSDDELRRLRCEPPALSLGAASVEKRHHEESRW